VAVADVFGL